MGRAIVRDPQVFLFDEPLSNLDAKLRVAMRTEIKELHQRLKTTSIYVTHDQIEAMTMGDQIVVMRDGRSRADAARRSSSTTGPANLFVAGFIGSPAMNFLPGTSARATAAAPGRAGRRHALAAPAQRRRQRRPAVVFGTRPEHLDAGRRAAASRPQVVVVEPTGADTFVACRHGGTGHRGGVPRAPRLRARAARSTCMPDPRARTCSTPAAASGSPPDSSHSHTDSALPQTGDMPMSRTSTAASSWKAPPASPRPRRWAPAALCSRRGASRRR